MMERLKTIWMKFAAVLAAMNSVILLSFVFFFIVTPIGLCMRLFGISALSSSGQAGSGWIRLPPETDPRKPF